MAYEELTIEGRNAVIEAFRAGKTVDKIFVLEGCKDGPIQTVLREAKKQSTVVNFVKKERLDQLSETGKHQGVIAHLAAYEYSTVEEIMDRAAQKGEAPFVILLDGIEDPHNLGSIIRTANQAGAHGVIIPKRTSCWFNCHCGKGICRSDSLYSGCKGNESGQNHGRTQETGDVVCLWRYVRRDDVFA